MKRAIVYIHGKGGSAEESIHYKALFPECDVIGFDYKAETPWDAKNEFAEYFDKVCREYDAVDVIANSIGAFFVMSTPIDTQIERAFFISPIVNMEQLIADMMLWANVTEDELREKGKVQTAFGETLSWEYLSYVRTYPICWNVPTHILYGGNDNLTSCATFERFARQVNATLTVMEEGEHWFHTEEQMRFLDDWICERGRL